MTVANDGATWWVSSNAAHARLTSSLEEALALGAHLSIRGHQMICIERGGKVVIDAMQMRSALENLGNTPLFPVTGA